MLTAQEAHYKGKKFVFILQPAQESNQGARALIPQKVCLTEWTRLLFPQQTRTSSGNDGGRKDLLMAAVGQFKAEITG